MTPPDQSIGNLTELIEHGFELDADNILLLSHRVSLKIEREQKPIDTVRKPRELIQDLIDSLSPADLRYFDRRGTVDSIGVIYRRGSEVPLRFELILEARSFEEPKALIKLVRFREHPQTAEQRQEFDQAGSALGSRISMARTTDEDSLEIPQPALTRALQEAYRVGASDLWVSDSGTAFFRTGPCNLQGAEANIDSKAVIYDLLSDMEPASRLALYQRGHHQDIQGEVEPEDGLSSLRYRALLTKNKFSNSITATIRTLPRNIPHTVADGEHRIEEEPSMIFDSPVGTNPGLVIDRLIAGTIIGLEGYEDEKESN